VLTAPSELAAHLALDEVRERVALAGAGVRLAVLDRELQRHAMSTPTGELTRLKPLIDAYTEENWPPRET
jgi:hypothetical protein